MKGRKNKSALISSSSRFVSSMHIQEPRILFLSPSLFRSRCSVSLFISLDCYQPFPDSRGYYHGLVRTSTNSILTYVRQPLISRLPSLIAAPR